MNERTDCLMSRGNETKSDALTKVAKDDLEAVLLISLSTGIHPVDVAFLRWDNVNLEEWFIDFYETAIRQPVLVPFEEAVFRCLDALPKSEDPMAYLFPQLAQMFPVDLAIQLQAYVEQRGATKPLAVARRRFLASF